jgi:hypothetical protein
MSTINDVIVSEEPRDVILFLTKNESGISYPRLDGLYNRNGWVKISNNFELLKLVSNMVNGGFIVDTGGGLKKGPNWKEPAFITEKKYSFE